MNGYARIVDLVSEQTGISVETVMDRCRSVPIFNARALAMYLIWNTRSQDMADRRTTTVSTIARYFQRDRATVVNAIQRTEDRVRASEDYAGQVRNLRRGLEA